MTFRVLKPREMALELDIETGMMIYTHHRPGSTPPPAALFSLPAPIDVGHLAIGLMCIGMFAKLKDP